MSVLVKWTMPLYPVATLPNGSKAVTVTVPATPAVAGLAMPATLKFLAAAAPTTIEACVPVMESVTVSAAVIEPMLAVLRVTLKAWTPASAAVKV